MPLSSSGEAGVERTDVVRGHRKIARGCEMRLRTNQMKECRCSSGSEVALFK